MNFSKIKNKIWIYFILFPYLSFSQSYDVVIPQINYTSFFENDYCCPTVVIYNLYKGGGDCSRKKFKFKNDKQIVTSTDKDFVNSGYDKGHLANSEDFAYDCELNELTFRFYNCVPQHPKLNRGIWKKVENEIRKISQKKEITVMCINIFNDEKYLPNSKVRIPTECIKLVWESKTENPLKGYVFTNNSNPQLFEMSHEDIVKKYNLNLSKFFY